MRILSADLQHVRTVAGTTQGHLDGAATVHARFKQPTSLLQLPDGRVLIADRDNNRIRVLSRELTVVSTIAGGDKGYVNGPAGQARFCYPCAIAALPDGSVLMGAKPAAKPPKRRHPHCSSD